MDIEQRHLWLASAPSLLFWKLSPEKNGAQGTIVFYHGLAGQSRGRGAYHFASRLPRQDFWWSASIWSGMENGATLILPRAFCRSMSEK